jgi:N-methylhydantoinase A/oxoprolinase/acetone carboxylase beta subunit
MNKKSILHHYVEISDDGGLLGRANKFEVADLEILGENDRYLVVNDRTFTTIDKTAAKYCVGRPFGKEEIHITANDRVWGNRITYSLYSHKRKKAEAIRKAIEKEVQKRFGFFTSGLDLSIIKDAAQQKDQQP